jgi:hypothetical protein
MGSGFASIAALADSNMIVNGIRGFLRDEISKFKKGLQF